MRPETDKFLIKRSVPAHVWLVELNPYVQHWHVVLSVSGSYWHCGSQECELHGLDRCLLHSSFSDSFQNNKVNSQYIIVEVLPKLLISKSKMFWFRKIYFEISEL